MPDPSEFSTLHFALVGILIVFAALVIVSAAVALVRRADERWQKREKRAEEEAYEREPTIDNLALVLIAAAAATMIQGRFHIRRVRRLMPGEPMTGVWSAYGRAILHGSHVLPKRRY